MKRYSIDYGYFSGDSGCTEPLRPDQDGDYYRREDVVELLKECLRVSQFFITRTEKISLFEKIQAIIEGKES